MIIIYGRENMTNLCSVHTANIGFLIDSQGLYEYFNMKHLMLHPQKAANRPPHLQNKKNASNVQCAPLSQGHIQQEIYSYRRNQKGVWGGAPTGGQSPPLQNLLTIMFQVQLLRSHHVYAIYEVNAYTPVLVQQKFGIS